MLTAIVRASRSGLRQTWSGPWAAASYVLHRAQRFPEVSQPGILVFPHQPDAPGQRIAAAARDACVHESVQNEPLGLAKPGHDRNGERRKHHSAAAAGHAPRDL